MSLLPIYLVLGALAAGAAGVPAWAIYAPRSFWYGVRFPVKAVKVYLTWAHVSASCGLAVKRRRWRWTVDAVPVAGPARRVLLAERRRVHRVEVPWPPGIGLLHPSALGWSVRIRMRDGQVPPTMPTRPSGSRTPGGSTPSGSPGGRQAGSGCWPPALTL